MNKRATTHPELDEISILKGRIKELEQSESIRMRMEEDLKSNRMHAERLAQEMAVINEIGWKITSTLDIDDVYERLAAESRKLITYDRLVVTLINFEDDSFTVAYVAGLEHPERRPGGAFPMAGSVTEAVQRKRSGIIAQGGDASEVSRTYPYTTILQMDILSHMTVPLISQDKVIGALHFRSMQPNAYTAQDLRLAEGICREIAGAIANARLFDQVKLELEERKRAEAALFESEERYRDLVERTDCLVSTLDEQGRITYINTVGEKILGRTKDNLLGLPAFQFVHPDDQPRAEKWYKTCLSSLLPQSSIEVRLINASTGETFHVLWTSTFTYDEKKLLKGIGSIANDITERKRTEQEMAILAYIGRLINSTLDIDEVYERFAAEVRKLIPCDRISVDLNNHAEATFSIAYVSGIDIPGRNPGDVVPLKGSISGTILRTRTGLLIDHASLEEIDRRFPGTTNITTIRAGMRSFISVPLISRDEVIGTLHLRARKANAYTERDLRLAEKIGMQIAGAIANAQLFSTLSKTEQSLRESNELFSLVMHHSPIYAYIKEVTPTQSRVLQASESFTEMIGIPGSAMVGKTMAELFPPEFALKITADDRSVVSNGDVLTLDEEFNGRSYRTIKFPIILGDRDLVAGYTMDITERKRDDEALQETLNHLEARVRERTIELEEINTALRVLLKKGERDQKNLEEILQSNVNQLVIPFLHKLKTTFPTKENHQSYLNILETNLTNIVSPFINHLSTSFRKLTPTEIQIAELIKQGKKSKEIAELFGVAVGTVITHRNNIRKKLNLKAKDANLRSHLLSMA
ncbi:MAG: PAS domain S-box protein [Syntrophales bacterium]